MLILMLTMFSVMCCWHDHIQSAAMPINRLPQSSNMIIRNNPVSIPKTSSTTSSMGSMDYVGIAIILSQLNKPNINSIPSHTDHTSYISTKGPKSLYQESLAEKKEFINSLNPYAQRAQELAQAHLLAEQVHLRADHTGILKEERAQIRVEKEILQQFNILKESAFSTIKSEYVGPIQLTNYKDFFIYLKWREEGIYLAGLDKTKIEEQARIIACEEIKSVIALAIVALNDDQKKKLQFLINSSTNCNQISDKKEDGKKTNIFFEKTTHKNEKNETSDSKENHPHYERNEISDDRGNRGVLHEYSADTPGGKVEFAVGSKYEQYDTTEKCTDIEVSIKYTPNEPQDSSPEPQTHEKQSEQRNEPQQDSSDRSSFQDHIKDSAMSREFDKMVDRNNMDTQFQKQDSYDYPERQRSAIYTWCKKKKEDFVGPSKKTIDQQQQAERNTAQCKSQQVGNQDSSTNSIHPSIDLTPSLEDQDPMSQAALALLATIIHKSLPDQTNLPFPADKKATRHQDDEKCEKTTTPDQRRQLLEAQDTWMTNNAEFKDNSMVQYMLNVIVYAKNDMTIEVAQLGLRALEQARDAQTEEYRKYNLTKSQLYYDMIQRQTPMQSIAQQAKPIYTVVVDTLLQNYNAALKSHTSSNQELGDAAHIQRLEKRAQALSQSKDQLRACKALPQRSYELSPQARGFMMANNINYAAFDGGNVTNFQHCLTQEILGIVESSANMAQNHNASSIIGQLARYNCNLAVSAQQLNQLSQIEQASILTDLTHFFDAYGQLLVDAGIQNQATMNFSLGVIDGSIQALLKWSEFGQKLSNSPRQTLGELAENLKNVGVSVLKVGAKIAQEPFLQCNNLALDMQDALDSIQQGDGATGNPSRAAQRTQDNAQALANGVSKAFHAGQTVIENMMQKSTRENVAGVTEIVVDNLITAKVTDALLHLSSMVGNQFLQTANAINKNLPPHLRDSTVTYTATSTGDIIAIADATGENIATAMTAQAATNRADQIIKNTVRARGLADRINEFTVKNKAEATAKTTEYHKNLAEVTAATEIRSVDRLQEISKDIPQVEEFRKYTNDFKNLEKLNPEEVMYLNLCDWLEPQAAAINAEIKTAGGLKFIDPVTKADVVIEKFDLVHSLLGEMKPQAVANRTSGGHLWISELRAATLDIGKIESFGNGFFDMEIKYAGKVSDRYKSNSYFPVGTTVEQAVEMIENTIANSKGIQIADEVKNPLLQGFIITNQQNQKFMVLIQDKIAQFYPYKPKM